MLRKLFTAGAVAACLIGSAQPAQAKLTDCWFFDDDNQYDVEAVDCDVTRRRVPSDRTTSGYLSTWIIRDANSSHYLEAVLWTDETAEFTFIDRQGNITGKVDGEWWRDADGDVRLSLGDGEYQIAFTEPSSDYGAGAAYPPVLGGGRESYQPIRGGGLSSGEFSSRPFHF